LIFLTASDPASSSMRQQAIKRQARQAAENAAPLSTAVGHRDHDHDSELQNELPKPRLEAVVGDAAVLDLPNEVVQVGGSLPHA
jgi:hypothetical protein